MTGGPLRIGLVTGEFPPMEGGVGAFTEQLAKALARLGHEIHLIVPKKVRPADSSRRLSDINEPVDIGYAQLHPRTGRWRWPTMSTVTDIAIRHDLQVVNLQYQAAAYNMSSPAPNFLPWRMKTVTPVVVTFHDLRTPFLFPKAGSLRERAVQFMARQARGCIATNAADLRVLQSWGASPVREIPIGSNIDVYHPNHIEVAEVREKLGLENGDILIGYFGFLNETKGADHLVEALARLGKRYHLVFIGGQTGDSDQANNQAFLEQLQQRIEQLGLDKRVHWTGYLQPMRVSTYLGAADLMALPYRDGASPRRGTLMAAIAHGRPVVTTQPAETTPVFRHGENMWLIQPQDADGLAQAIATVAADPELRARLAAGASDLARQYAWETIAGHTETFFREIVESTREHYR